MNIESIFLCMIRINRVEADYSAVLFITGGRGHLVKQNQWVTALSWPGSKGMFEGRIGLVGDTLLVGRLDGTLAMVDMVDSSTFRCFELEHCRRRNGNHFNFFFIIPLQILIFHVCHFCSEKFDADSFNKNLC